MAFTRNTVVVNNITNQPNQPVISATALKALFDQSDVDQKSYDNSVLLPELESIVDGGSGADNIGATPLVGGTANTVQGVLEELDLKIEEQLPTPANSIDNTKLATDVKVGSLASLSVLLVGFTSSVTVAINKVVSWIGDLSTLTTVNKTSLVNALNEVNAKKIKNYIINGAFDVWQVATSQTTNGYGSADMFTFDSTTSTFNHSQQVFAVGQPDVPNNPKYFSRTVVTTGGTAGSKVREIQNIEDVTRLAGLTFPFSIWARADSNKYMSIDFTQVFGSGGSASVNGIGTAKFAVTPTWQEFTTIVMMPSITGKIVGANSYTGLSVWFDAGSDFNVRTGSLGNQSGTFDIALLNAGATNWIPETFDEVFTKCGRYFEKSDFLTGIDGARTSIAGNVTNAMGFYFITPKRIAPVIKLYSRNGTIDKISSINSGLDAGTVVTATSISSTGVHLISDSGSGLTAGVGYEFNYTADARL